MMIDHRWKPKLLAAALALAILSACAPAAGSAPGSSAAAPAPESSAPAPESAADPAEEAGEESGEETAVPILAEFTATDLAGEAVDQSIFEGYDLTMVNIWATFCGPCLREMPDLGALHREFQGENFQIVGIVTDTLARDGSIDPDQAELARQIVEETGADYRHLLPSEDLTARVLWQVNSVPTTIFVDEKGSLVGLGYLGSRDADAWRAIIREKLDNLRGEGETP